MDDKPNRNAVLQAWYDTVSCSRCHSVGVRFYTNSSKCLLCYACSGWSDVLATPDESAMPSQTIVASDYEWAMTKNTLLFIRGFFHNGCVE